MGCLAVPKRNPNLLVEVLSSCSKLLLILQDPAHFTP